MGKIITGVIVAFFALVLSSPAFSAEEQVIAGAGPSTRVVELLVKDISRLPFAKDYSFKVPPKSAKHAGGIENSNQYIFGRTGRPLNSAEKALGKNEIFIARLPISFVVGPKVGVEKLTIGQVEDIFTGKIKNWKELGGPDAAIVTIGREPTEALFTVLKRQNPSFENARFNKVLKKDHLVVKFLLLSQGSYAIAFGAKPNFEAKGIVLLDVAGFSSGVEVGLVYDDKNKDRPLVKGVREFVRTGQWARSVKGMGLLPPE